jgi:hypothetical protein
MANFNLKQIVSIHFFNIEEDKFYTFKKEIIENKFLWNKFKFTKIIYENRFLNGFESINGKHNGISLETLLSESNNRFIFNECEEKLYIRSRMLITFSNGEEYIMYFDTNKKRDKYYEEVIEPYVDLIYMNMKTKR